MKTKTLFDTLLRTLFRSWWVCAFMLGCLVLYEQSLKNRETQRVKLLEQWQRLKTDKSLELTKQQDLQEKISSQKDPAWVELTLMKELGLVPDKQTKIYFEAFSPMNTPARYND